MSEKFPQQGPQRSPREHPEPRLDRVKGPLASVHILWLALLLIPLLALTACYPGTSRTGSGPAALVGPEGVVNDADKQRLLAEGKRLLAQASNSPPPLRDQLYMRAAEAFLRGDDLNQAREAAARVSSGRLPPSDLFDWNMLSAEINMKVGSPSQALRDMPGQPPAGMAREQLRRYYRNLAEAHQQSGNFLESARARTLLEPLLDKPEEKLDNQLRLVKSLTQMSDSALEQLQPSPPGVLGGWMELARVFKRHGENLAAAKPDYDLWRGRFPDHPAASDLYAKQYGNIQNSYRRLNQIAVLLPQSGPLQGPASALRDGIMAAHYAEPAHQRPAMRFYDNSNIQALGALYEQAVSEGAVAVIGPLEKKAVAQLASRGDLPVPTLALNQNPSEVRPPRNLYQFALTPESEAQQVAERAWHDGHTSALAMVPDSDWGRRLLEAFRGRWTALGGTLAEHKLYNEKQHDFSKELQDLLNLNTSVARHKEMQRETGGKLESEPRRRTDAQFIFLAASPEKGREIRPQLQFNFAGDLPVYATSRVFAGNIDVRQDRDLNGIRFPDLPWLLEEGTGPLSRQAVAKLFPSSRTRFPRLYAMGIDSYNLLRRLDGLAQPGGPMDGQTGKLSLDHNQHVQFQLLWAQMKDGKPQVLGYTPASPPAPAGTEPPAAPADRPTP